ncbi:Zinc finger CCHC-type protein [Dioscorea alata]|uniref:Zinc finger CCHC-type protein n=1 Tax=Dioscorea alata TaxID=55571 RepID=A0ACB7WR08_DIOAL|nr:Zinc finger CCHC-type protein [Dioscorea alata]
MSYSQAVSSSSSGERRPPKVGLKRPRSPIEQTCGRCFRTSHKMEECRHQIVCLRCSCVGHMAARCTVDLRRSPHRRKLHVHTKRKSNVESSPVKPPPLKVAAPPTEHLKPTRTAISLPLHPETSSLRDELAKVAVVGLTEGFVNEASILEIIPSIINKDIVGPITPINECNYIIPLSSRAEVKEIAKLGSVRAATKDGPCVLSFSHWSAELGAEGKASGEGCWVSIWNLPLHGWCWSVISEVLRPVGELISLSQVSAPHKIFISALVRRRHGVALPLELDLSYGMRRYHIIITSDRCKLPRFRRDLGRYVLAASDDQSDDRPPAGRRCTHDISGHEKGKAKIRSESTVDTGGTLGRVRDRGLAGAGSLVITGARSSDEVHMPHEPSCQRNIPVTGKSSSVNDLLESTAVEPRSRVAIPTEIAVEPSSRIATQRTVAVEPSSRAVEPLRDARRRPGGSSVLSRGTDGRPMARSPESSRPDRSDKRQALSARWRRVANVWKPRTGSPRDAAAGKATSEVSPRVVAGKTTADTSGPSFGLSAGLSGGLRSKGNQKLDQFTCDAELSLVLGQLSHDQLEPNSALSLDDPIISCELQGLFQSSHKVTNVGCFDAPSIDVGPNEDSDNGVKEMETAYTNVNHPTSRITSLKPLSSKNDSVEPPQDKLTDPIVGPTVDLEEIPGRPSTSPPWGFKWHFLTGLWVLIPDPNHPHLTEGDLDNQLERAGIDSVLADQEVEDPTPVTSLDSDDHASDFDRNLQALLTDFQGGQVASAVVPPSGTRRSDRPKKPPSRFNEDAGYLSDLPKSTKKKSTRMETPGGTPAKPLLISEWSYAQLAKYCDACGVSFIDSEIDCLNHIRCLESNQASSSRGPATTSMEVGDI